MKKFNLEDRKIFVLGGNFNEVVVSLHKDAENVNGWVEAINSAEGVTITAFGEELRVIDVAALEDAKNNDTETPEGAIFVDRKIFVEEGDDKAVVANYGINVGYSVEAPFETASELGEFIITNGDEINPYANLAEGDFGYTATDKNVHLDIMLPLEDNRVALYSITETGNGEILKHNQEFGIEDVIDMADAIVEAEAKLEK
ncbi:MAG: hypothetical protein ACRC92_17305 [Peptostreptococcaceae bacterium]